MSEKLTYLPFPSLLDCYNNIIINFFNTSVTIIIICRQTLSEAQLYYLAQGIHMHRFLHGHVHTNCIHMHKIMCKHVTNTHARAHMYMDMHWYAHTEPISVSSGGH